MTKNEINPMYCGNFVGKRVRKKVICAEQALLLQVGKLKRIDIPNMHVLKKRKWILYKKSWRKQISESVASEAIN